MWSGKLSSWRRGRGMCHTGLQFPAVFAGEHHHSLLTWKAQWELNNPINREKGQRFRLTEAFPTRSCLIAPLDLLSFYSLAQQSPHPRSSWWFPCLHLRNFTWLGAHRAVKHRPSVWSTRFSWQKIRARPRLPGW